MSTIYVSALKSSEFRIQGAERAWMGLLLAKLAKHYAPVGEADFANVLDAATRNEPESRLIARIHGQCEIGLWVRGEDCRWLGAQLRRAISRTVFVADRDFPESGHQEPLLRQAYSTGNREDGTIRSRVMPGVGRLGWGWLSLIEWLEQNPEPYDADGAIVFWYSVSEYLFPQDIGGYHIRKWLEANDFPRLGPDNLDDHWLEVRFA